MGYDVKTLTVTARVSRHNSERDEEHDALWEELTARIQELVSDPHYAEISAFIP